MKITTGLNLCQWVRVREDAPAPLPAGKECLITAMTVTVRVIRGGVTARDPIRHDLECYSEPGQMGHKIWVGDVKRVYLEPMESRDRGTERCPHPKGPQG